MNGEPLPRPPNKSSRGRLYVLLAVLSYSVVGHGAPPMAHARLAATEQALVPVPVAYPLVRRAVELSRSWWAPWVSTPDQGVEELELAVGEMDVLALLAGSGSRTVILLPHLDGTRRVAEVAVWRLARREGLRVLAILPPNGQAIDEKTHPRELIYLLQQRARVGRSVVAYARQELGATCVVVGGVSLGGTIAVTVAAIEGADGFVSILGGGGLELILEESGEERLREVRNRTRALSEHEREALSAEIDKLDPVSWTSALEETRGLVVRAYFDRVMPRESMDTLVDRLAGASVLTLPTGHYSAGPLLPYVFDQVADFVEETCTSR